MNKKRTRILELVGTATAAAVVVLYLWVALNQPVPANSQTPAGPTTPPPGSTPSPTTPPSTPPPSAPPPPPSPLGNGHKVPNGWAHANCPTKSGHGNGHGVTSRCDNTATYGALKKAGQTGSSITAESGASLATPALGAANAGLAWHSLASGANPGKHLGWY